MILHGSSVPVAGAGGPPFYELVASHEEQFSRFQENRVVSG